MDRAFPSFLKPKYKKSLSQAQVIVQILGPYMHLIIGLILLGDQKFGYFLSCMNHADFDTSYMNAACSNKALTIIEETNSIKPIAEGDAFQYYKSIGFIHLCLAGLLHLPQYLWKIICGPFISNLETISKLDVSIFQISMTFNCTGKM